jgi:hypothetical protein
MTAKCLDSVSHLKYENFAVVVVDNKSVPEHVEKIKNKVLNLGSRYFLIESPENRGYGAGNNLGIKFGLENGAEYIFVLNNDTELKPETLAELITVAEKEKLIGIVAPALDESNKIAYAGKICWLQPELEHIYQFLNSEITDDMYLPGTAILVKKEVFEKIGMMDEKYFLYFEDVDFSIRTFRAGYKLIIRPETTIKHQVSSTTKNLGSPLLLRYHFRNAHLLNWRFAPIWAKILLPFWSILVILKQLVKIILFPAKREISRFILKGVTDFYLGKFGKIQVK